MIYCRVLWYTKNMMKKELTLNARQIRYLASIGVLSQSNAKGGRGHKRPLTDGEQLVIELVAVLKSRGIGIHKIPPTLLAVVAVNPGPFLYSNENLIKPYSNEQLIKPFCVYWDGTNWTVEFEPLEISKIYIKAMREKATFYGVDLNKVKELWEVIHDIHDT